jgi:hypothetical protein
MGANDEPGNRTLPQTETPAELVRRRRNRNLALLAALLAFVVIIYVLSFVKMGGG